MHALLDIPTTLPKRDVEAASDQERLGASAVPVWKWRVDSEVRRESRLAWLKTAGLAVMAMAVVLIAGGIAMTAQRSRALPAQAAAPAPTAAPAAKAPAVAQAAMSPLASDLTSASATEQETDEEISAAAFESSDTWVVQVGAFSNHDRSQSLVQRLTQSGFPAFEVPTEGSRGVLYYVRVGPFETAGEADQARARLHQLTELENAFVRSVTSVP